MTLPTYLSGERIQGKTTDALVASTTLTESFASNTGWTTNNGSYQTWSASNDGTLTTTNSSHAYKSFAIGEPTTMVMDFDWKITNSTPDAPFVILSSETSGYGDPSSGHKRIILMINASGSTGLRISGRYNDGSLSEDNSANNTWLGTYNVKQYYRFKVSGGNFYLSIYGSAADRQAESSVIQTISFTGYNAKYTSGTADFAYLDVGSYGAGGTSVIYNWDFWTGVANPATDKSKAGITDVPVGTRYEETDTELIFRYAEDLVSGSGLKCYIKMNDSNSTDPLVNTAGSVTGNDTLGSSANMALGGTGTNTYGVTAPTDLGTGSVTFPQTSASSGRWGNLGTSTSQWNFMHNSNATWTVCFWMKMDDDAPNNTNILRNVSGDATNGITIYHYDSSSAGGGGLGFYISYDSGGNNDVVLSFFSATGFMVYDNEWHFYAFTWDQAGSANLKIYRDMGTTSPAYQTDNKTTDNNDDGNASYALGFRHYTAAAGGNNNNTYIPPTASYCELSIWDRTLTVAELTKIYNSGAGMDLVTGAKLWKERGVA